MATLVDRIAVVIDASSAGATKELESLQREAKKSGDAFDTIGKQAGLAGGAIKAGLAAGTAALIGGGLLKFLGDAVTKFQQAQTAAKNWSEMTNSSVEQAGKFTTVIGQYGVELEDLIEINATFMQQVEAQPELLEELNVQLTKNKDGTTDWNESMADVLTSLGEMPDKSQAILMALELFGEEGAKQLTPLINSGKDLTEAMDKINFTDQTAKAAEFAEASKELGTAFEEIQIQVGSFLVPILSDLLGLASGIIGFFTDLPGPVKELAAAFGLATGALILFNKARGPLSTLGAAVIDALNPIKTISLEMDAAAIKGEGSFKKLGAAASAAGRAAGPVLLLTGAIEGLLSVVQHDKVMQDFVGSSDAMGKSLAELADLRRNTDSITDSIKEFLTVPAWMGGEKTKNAIEDVTNAQRDAAQATLDSADANAVQKKAAQDLVDVINAGNLGTDEGTAAMQRYQDAMSGASKTTDEVQKSQKSLNDLIAAGGFTQQELADAANRTAEAQKKQKEEAHLAAAAMLPYATAAEKAAFWTDELNLVIEAGITQGGQFETAAHNAAEALFEQSEQTRLAEEAIDKFNFTYGQLIEDLQDTEVWGGGVESLKASLDGLDFKQVGDRWGDEWKIAAESARSSILSEMSKVAEFDPDFDPQKWLADLYTDAPPEVQKVIAAMQEEFKKNPLTATAQFKTPGPADVQAKIDSLNTAIKAAMFKDPVLAEELKRQLEEVDPGGMISKINTAISSGDFGLAMKLAEEYNVFAAEHGKPTIDITVDPEGKATAVFTELTTPKTTNVAINFTGAEGAQEQITGLTAPKVTTITMNAVYNPSYNDMIIRRGYLAEPITSTVTWNAKYNPDYNDMVMRLGVLSENHTPDIDYWMHWHPGSYEEVVRQLDKVMSYDQKSPDINVWVHFNPDYNETIRRLDNIARNRSATIDVNTRGLAAAEAAMNRLNPSMTNRMVLPEIVMPTPVNLTRVYVDGEQLRAIVRDEMFNVRESDDLVAAMGTVA